MFLLPCLVDTVIENVIPPELVAGIREDVVAAVDTIQAEWSANHPQVGYDCPPGAEPGISQLVHLPTLNPWFAEERMVAVARSLLDPHVRIAQCEAVGGTTRPPNDDDSSWRSWHSVSAATSAAISPRAGSSDADPLHPTGLAS